jgi:hypothetical protein
MDYSKEEFKKEFIKRLIKFSIRSVKFAEKLKKEKQPFCLINQYIDASTSVGANVVEAKSAHQK